MNNTNAKGLSKFDTKEFIDLCAKNLPKELQLSNQDLKLLVGKIEENMPHISDSIEELMKQMESANAKGDEMTQQQVMSYFFQKVAPHFQEALFDVMKSFDQERKDN